MLKIVLVAVDTPLADAWEKFCGDLDFVEVHRGSIFDVKADAFVSPANSFGFMDGGIDMAYSQRFGWGVQERLQEIIRERHHGELLVGAAEIVETGVISPMFIIAAPTMRVPLILHHTVNPYLAARAVFLLIQHGTFAAPSSLAGEKISSVVKVVAFPGLGTGCGRVDPNICAYQVRAAIDEFVAGKNTFPTSWRNAAERHEAMVLGG
jgi:O-acetyl-ADP-ribose deacetylase (regulator of RNase III)